MPTGARWFDGHTLDASEKVNRRTCQKVRTANFSLRIGTEVRCLSLLCTSPPVTARW
jgi:hypothetical protein